MNELRRNSAFGTRSTMIYYWNDLVPIAHGLGITRAFKCIGQPKLWDVRRRCPFRTRRMGIDAIKALECAILDRGGNTYLPRITFYPKR